MLGGVAAFAGVVTGFLGRRSRRRRTAIAGSVLTGVAFLALGWAGFAIPYYTYVRGLAWSPDGTKIAYVAGVDFDQAQRSELWLMDADGGNPRARGARPLLVARRHHSPEGSGSDVESRARAIPRMGDVRPYSPPENGSVLVVVGFARGRGVAALRRGRAPFGIGRRCLRA